jgi:hypothetical protein
MTNPLRALLMTIALGAGTAAAQQVPIDWPNQPSVPAPSAQGHEPAAPGWQNGGGWRNAPQDDDDAANDTAIENEARQTDAELTTDYPAAAEPFESPEDVPYDEQELD